MIKSDDFGDVRPQFCFVRPRWCLSRTYVLSGEKIYLQPCSRNVAIYILHVSYYIVRQMIVLHYCMTLECQVMVP